MLRRAPFLLLLFAPLASAYSVLSHEAVIDTVWETSIKPLLKARFPQATDEELIKAHAFAYGGAIIQDAGYYPLGSHLFTDLVHYVRTGDFVVNMVGCAQTLDELAFAMGSLAHYVSDQYGHSLAINRAVPLVYPKLRRRFGTEIPYEDNPTAHLRMEFSLDVAQVANHHYAPQAYHDFIGFEVSKDVLDRAFRQTYSLELKDVLFSVDLALGTYRYAVGSILPSATKAAWKMRGKELVKAEPSLTRQRFVYNLSRASFEKEWGKDYRRPGILASLCAFLIRIIPKVGMMKVFAFRPPTPEAEKLFMESFNKTVATYRGLAARLQAGERLSLEDLNLDTGKPARPGRYHLADNAYRKLLDKLAKRDFAAVDPELARNIRSYYGAIKVDGETQALLTKLNASAQVPPQPPYSTSGTR
ncbi:MAG: zinc dependent phospholipase C family protein [Bryobacterales bacterium]|nr:zinc dependent phospholipase C family protein [Bryobacterales bacterium]